MFYDITFDSSKTGVSVLMKAIIIVLRLIFQFNLVLIALLIIGKENSNKRDIIISLKTMSIL